jgi:hypothetical protein
MARKLDQTLWEAWQRRISKQQRSGLSIVEVCRREGISQGSFHTWKRKLGRRDAVGRSPQRSSTAEGQRFAADAGPTVKLGASAAAGFVQVPLATAGGREWIEVVLHDGTLIRVPPHQTTALTTILRLLRTEDRTRQPLVEETHHA